MQIDRKGDWLTTYSGKQFWPFDPRPEDIDFEDIAHSLSFQCRFAGHCTKFYSVAQHCVLVSSYCDPVDALWGVIHDFSEGYLTDIPSPIKRLPEFAAYRAAEKNLMNIICDVIGLPHEEPESVKIADKRMLATEARDLTATKGRDWTSTFVPYNFTIDPWTPIEAKRSLLKRFDDLRRK